MKGDRKQFLANLFMVVSLVFLAGFLILFLVSNYKAEKANVQKEVGYLFVNSIRKIEGGILNKLVFQGDSNNLTKIHFSKMKRDSVKIRSVFSVADRNMTASSGKFEIEVKHEQRSNDINQMEGSVAMFIALDMDSTKIDDTCLLKTNSANFLKELEDNFRKNMESSNLSISYSIQKENEQTFHSKKDLVTGSYTDISSGERYMVNIENYGLLVFKKILPEVLFLILLFICIAAAFYLVYKTLASEKMLLNLKNDFIQNITHELKTPIATISVALEALQDFNVQENQKKREDYLDISKNELKRLSLLVDKVLNISQIEKELPPNQLSKLDLRLAILEILNTLKLQFEKLNVQVTFDSVGELFFISGNRERIDGLLYNLLDNAMKYNSSLHPQIIIQLVQFESHLQIIIKDNGIAIEHQKSIFEKLYRVPQGNIHNVKGHGLGLSYVAQVVAEMGADIKWESKIDEGSTFIIQIPVNYKV